VLLNFSFHRKHSAAVGSCKVVDKQYIYPVTANMSEETARDMSLAPTAVETSEMTPEPTLHTANTSVLEKPSPAPESLNQETEKSDPTVDDDTVYPGTLTKVGVGIGLAFAVFLVTPESQH
jgi:hypothetical protein